MSLSYSHGAIQWLSTDAVSTTYVVSGLGFQPKAMKFVWNGSGSATDAQSTTRHAQIGVGFATSTSDRRAIGAQDQDAVATTVCTVAYRDDSCAVLCTSVGPATSGRLDISAVGADGFTAIVDEQAGITTTVFWEAWGGSDITVATTVEISEPAATGTQTYTVTGFTSTDALDQVVMFSGCNLTSVNSVSRTDIFSLFGIATGTANTENISIACRSKNASASTDTARWGGSGMCLGLTTQVGLNMSAVAVLSAFATNGFTLNWTTRTTTGRKYIALAIKGGYWNAGELNWDIITPNNTTSVTGLSFTPIGLSLITVWNAESTVGTTATTSVIGHGMGISPTSRRSIESESVYSVSPSQIKMDVEYDQIMAYYDGSTVLVTIDINSMNNDGFQLIVDTAPGGGPNVQWFGYLTFGNLPVSSANAGYLHRYRKNILGA